MNKYYRALANKPMTAAQLAAAVGTKVQTARVAVAKMKAEGVVKPVDHAPGPAGHPFITVWGVAEAHTQ